MLASMYGTDMRTLLGYTASERAKTYSDKILSGKRSTLK